MIGGVPRRPGPGWGTCPSCRPTSPRCRGPRSTSPRTGTRSPTSTTTPSCSPRTRPRRCVRLRSYSRKDVAPLVENAWERAEFPMQLVGRFADLDLAGLPYGLRRAPARRRQPVPRHAALEMARADASVRQLLRRPQRPRDGLDPRRRRQEQRDRWLPAMARDGQDRRVRADRAARRLRRRAAACAPPPARRRHWVLNGAKRWIGNATFADFIVVWARDVETNQVKGFVVAKGTPGHDDR